MRADFSGCDLMRRVDGWCSRRKKPIRKLSFRPRKGNKWKIIGWIKENKPKLNSSQLPLTTGEKNRIVPKRKPQGLSFFCRPSIEEKRNKFVGYCTLWPRSTTSSSSEASEQKSSLSPPFELRLDVLLTFLLYNWLANALEPAANPTPLLPGLESTKHF